LEFLGSAGSLTLMRILHSVDWIQLAQNIPWKLDFVKSVINLRLELNLEECVFVRRIRVGV
jgi:hypothetical protein